MSWFIALCNVTFVNLILSGDNTLAISMAASKLPSQVRKKAIVWGSIIAILLLVLFIAIGNYIIGLPVLRTVAGVMLLVIAIHLSLENMNHSAADHDEADQMQSSKLWKAIRMIALADLMMSLDNAVAMLGVAGGRMGVLMVSLIIAIPFIIFGSHFIAAVLQKFSWIVYIAATYIAWLAGSMVAEDPIFENISWNSLLHWAAPVLCVLIFCSVLLIIALRRRGQATRGKEQNTRAVSNHTLTQTTVSHD